MTDRLRRDPLTGSDTLYVPERARRPTDRNRPENTCPFCPGNEALLREILWEMPASDGRPWAARAVPNRFPLVRPGASDEASPEIGRHEVIIETPRHDGDPARLSGSEMTEIAAAYRHRARAMAADHETVILFRNRGERGGASLVHPHAQIVGLNAVPSTIGERLERQRRHFEATGRCMICDFVAEEIAGGKRLIARSGGFIAFVPAAATVPFEILIAPEKHLPAFHAMPDADTDSFAAILHDVLKRLADRACDPDYSFAIADSRHAPEQSGWHHWHLRLRPATATPGGFELGTGLFVNSSSAERDAAVLREDSTVR